MNVDEDIIPAVSSTLEKFPDVKVIAVDLINTLFYICIDVFDARVLNKLMNTFYNGSNHWSCKVNGNSSIEMTDKSNVTVHFGFNREKFSDEDFKREIDYKICLLKSALGG